MVDSSAAHAQADLLVSCLQSSMHAGAAWDSTVSSILGELMCVCVWKVRCRLRQHGQLGEGG